LKTFISVLLVFTYLNSARANEDIDKKIDALLVKMTLEQKIGQMTQLNITTIIQDSILKDYSNVKKFVLDTARLSHFIRKWHVGSFLNGRAVDPQNWVYVTGTIQSINAQYSEIPILYGIDHMHGASYLKNGTIFPHNINMGCSFDTVHAFNAARTSVYETSHLGHNWVFAPVLGIGRQKSWGRFYETYSEDPLLTARMGAAAVHGIQDFSATDPYRVAACPKHFLGYSDPKSGWDRSPAEISDQALREFFLPPFKAAIDAGALTIMINSAEINGIPVHASYDILTTLLREELGFKGLAVSDWLDIKALNEMHFITLNEKESTYQAIMAGLDMSMVPLDTSFAIYLRELVLEGRIPMSRIDTSVRRILWVKLKLGLFNTFMPRTDRFDRINTSDSKELSLNAARESIVLIKNENHVLPVKDKKILLSGFTHNRKSALCGGWTYRFAADNDDWFPQDMQTIKDAFEQTFGEKNIICQETEDISKISKEADVIVIATGENEAYAETQGTIDDLNLDNGQIQLIKAAIATSKPVIIILTEGRPRLLSDVFDKVDAVLFAGLPGFYGARAIAEIVSGKVNPSGKMSFSYPKKSAHIISYNHKRSEYTTFRPVSEELKRFALAPFGYGLSYSTFEYSNLKMDTLITSPDQTIQITVDVQNTSAVPGKEAVLWFISDHVGSITRPVKELVHFEKQLITPGESKTFTFNMSPVQSLSFPDKNGNILLEDGSFDVQVGNLQKQFWFKKAKGE
jgi:beta-glucosidase